MVTTPTEEQENNIIARKDERVTKQSFAQKWVEDCLGCKSMQPQSFEGAFPDNIIRYLYATI